MNAIYLAFKCKKGGTQKSTTPSQNLMCHKGQLYSVVLLLHE